MKHASLAALPILLAACGQPPAGTAPAGAEPSAYAFEVRLTLTPRAAEKLSAARERVIVDAMYFGIPVSEDAPGVMAPGQGVGLGADQIEVAPENAVVKADGAGFDPTHLPHIRGAPEVLVNIYSARRSHADNLLSCGIYQGPVAMARKQPVDIECDLISGPETPAPSPP